MAGSTIFTRLSRIAKPKYRCWFFTVVIITVSILMTPILPNESSACDWCHRKANIYVFCEDQYRAEVAALAQNLFDVINTDCFTLGFYSENYIEYAFSLSFYIDSVGQSKCYLILWYVGGKIPSVDQANVNPKLGIHVKEWFTTVGSHGASTHLGPLKKAIGQSPPMHEIVWNWAVDPYGSTPS